MKLLFLKTWSVGLLLFAGPLLHGYAIVHGSGSALPAVDIYAYKAKDAKDAIRQHKAYALTLSVPGAVADVLEVAKGVSAPIGAALAGPTEGFSVAVAQGFDITAKVLIEANKMFGTQIQGLLGRLHRGETNAFHPDVPRGNSGRFAEWRTGDVYYVIVTLHDNLVPLHEGAVLASVGAKKIKNFLGRETILPANVIGFEIRTSPDPNKPGNQIYQAVFSDGAAREYIQADADQRTFKNNKAEMLKRAKISGSDALEQPVPKG